MRYPIGPAFFIFGKRLWYRQYNNDGTMAAGSVGEVMMESELEYTAVAGTNDSAPTAVPRTKRHIEFRQKIWIFKYEYWQARGYRILSKLHSILDSTSRIHYT